MYRLLIKVPPQKGLISPLRTRAACQGILPGFVVQFCPGGQIILPPTRGTRPHSQLLMFVEVVVVEVVVVVVVVVVEVVVVVVVVVIVVVEIGVVVVLMVVVRDDVKLVCSSVVDEGEQMILQSQPSVRPIFFRPPPPLALNTSLSMLLPENLRLVVLRPQYFL